MAFIFSFILENWKRSTVVWISIWQILKIFKINKFVKKFFFSFYNSTSSCSVHDWFPLPYFITLRQVGTSLSQSLYVWTHSKIFQNLKNFFKFFVKLCSSPVRKLLKQPRLVEMARPLSESGGTRMEGLPYSVTGNMFRVVKSRLCALLPLDSTSPLTAPPQLPLLAPILSSWIGCFFPMERYYLYQVIHPVSDDFLVKGKNFLDFLFFFPLKGLMKKTRPLDELPGKNPHPSELPTCTLDELRGCSLAVHVAVHWLFTWMFICWHFKCPFLSRVVSTS